jgi:hypothetical protein
MQAQALQLLRQAIGGDTATFRDGQWQAIAALVQRRARLLVVQRTGWGKSLVYFLATKFLRDQGAGCTILISPLLSLISNQIAAARRIGVKPLFAVTLRFAPYGPGARQGFEVYMLYVALSHFSPNLKRVTDRAAPEAIRARRTIAQNIPSQPCKSSPRCSRG